MSAEPRDQMPAGLVGIPVTNPDTVYFPFDSSPHSTLSSNPTMYPFPYLPPPPPLHYPSTYTPHTFFPHLPTPTTLTSHPHTLTQSTFQPSPFHEATPIEPTLASRGLLNRNLYPPYLPSYYQPAGLSYPSGDGTLPNGGENISLAGELVTGATGTGSRTATRDGFRIHLNEPKLEEVESPKVHVAGNYYPREGEDPSSSGQLPNDFVADATAALSSTVAHDSTLPVQLGVKRQLSLPHVSQATNTLSRNNGVQNPRVKVPRCASTQQIVSPFQVPVSWPDPSPHSSSQTAPFLAASPYIFSNNPLFEGQTTTEGCRQTEDRSPALNSACLPSAADSSVVASGDHASSTNRVSVSVRFPLQARHHRRESLHHYETQNSPTSEYRPSVLVVSQNSTVNDHSGGPMASSGTTDEGSTSGGSLASSGIVGGSLETGGTTSGGPMASVIRQTSGGSLASSGIIRQTSGGSMVSGGIIRQTSGGSVASSGIIRQTSGGPVVSNGTLAQTTGGSNGQTSEALSGCTEQSSGGSLGFGGTIGQTSGGLPLCRGQNSLCFDERQRSKGNNEVVGNAFQSVSRDAHAHISHDSHSTSHEHHIGSHDHQDGSHDHLVGSRDHHGQQRLTWPRRPSVETSDSELTQVVPNQSSGRGFSLSVEISGSRRGNTIDLNLDVSGIEQNSPGATANSLSSSLVPSPTSPAPSTVTIPSPSPPIHVLPSSEMPGTSGLGAQARDEVIIVDSSDDEDDHTVIMFTHRHGNQQHSPATTSPRRGHREVSQISRDEVLARRLQAQYDQESTLGQSHAHDDDSSNLVPVVFPRPVQPVLFPPPPPSSSSSSMESNVWSSRGPSGAIPSLPHIPSIDPSNHPGPSTDTTVSSSNNYHALASHIHRITPTDAHRLLRIASLSGRPSVVGGRRRRRSQFHSNHSVIFNAIMGRNSSYEELLELAERLGPAQARGLTREEINRLPSRTHRKRDGDDKSCVVCMSEFQVREKIRTLKPCSHDFHQKCIDKWLKEHNTCPICRVKVSPQVAPPSSSTS